MPAFDKEPKSKNEQAPDIIKEPVHFDKKFIDYSVKSLFISFIAGVIFTLLLILLLIIIIKII